MGINVLHHVTVKTDDLEATRDFYRDVFGFEGYLAMLVGMNVPARRRFVPDEREEGIWKSIQQVNAGQAAEGMTVGEALRVVRSPDWRPRADFFRYPY